MVNTTEQNTKLQQINEQLRTRQNLATIVNDDIFGLLTNSQRNIIVDNNLASRLTNLNTSSDYAARIHTLNSTTIPNIQNAIRAEESALNISIGNMATATNQNQQNTLARQIEGQRTSIRNKEEELRKYNEELSMLNTYTAIIWLRRWDLTSIQTLLGSLKINDRIPHQTIQYKWNITPALDLNTTFVNWTPAIGYEFCDLTTGEPLTKEHGWRQVSINGQTITIKGLNIHGNNVQWSNIEIQPIENIKFPLRLEIGIRGRITQQNAWINLDHYKSLVLTINAPILPLTDRQDAYANLNTNHTIDKRIESEYTTNNTTRENEVIRDILRAGGNQAEVDAIYNNEARRELLIQRIRTLPGLIPVLQLGTLQAWFMTDMTKIDRKVAVQHLIDQNAFTDYIRQNLPENLRTYLKDQIRSTINNSANRNNILQQFMNFQSDVTNDKLDNNDHMTILNQMPNRQEAQWHSNNRFQRVFNRKSNKNNYTKFFEGREQNIDNQSMETDTWQIKYSVNVEVAAVNKMTATIKIEGKDEPEIIDGANHKALVSAILARTATKDGEPLNRKLRCRMALDIIKATVLMSPQRLHREVPMFQLPNAEWNLVDINRIEAFVRWWNMIIRGWGTDANRTRENITIFDEQRYKNLHDIGALENGVANLSDQITLIMNSMTKEYQTAVSNFTSKSLSNYNTKQFLRFGPAKRLRWRMRYGKTNRNFDFNTTATAGKKSVSIKFEKWEFIVSWDFKWEQYEFKSKNLGNILRKKKNRLRVFDGVELEIVEKVNEAMVTKLRTNNLIWPENFWVADLRADKTWKVYLMDDHGHLSYLEIEDRNLNPIPNKEYGRIPSNNLPPQRIRCNAQERKEFMQNPLLSGRLLRWMRHRLAVF